MTILQNLIQQAIDSNDVSAYRQERIDIDEMINVDTLNQFLDEAVTDIRRSSLWDADTARKRK